MGASVKAVSLHYLLSLAGLVTRTAVAWKVLPLRLASQENPDSDSWVFTRSDYRLGLLGSIEELCIYV